MKKLTDKEKARICDRVIALVWALQAETAPVVTTHLTTLLNHSDNAAELIVIANRQRRYEWRKVGDAEHLFPSNDKKGRSVAMIVKEGTVCKWLVTKTGSRTLSGTCPKISQARKEVEKHFNLLEEV